MRQDVIIKDIYDALPAVDVHNVKMFSVKWHGTFIRLYSPISWSKWEGRHLQPCVRIAWCGWELWQRSEDGECPLVGPSQLYSLLLLLLIRPLCQLQTRLSTVNSNSNSNCNKNRGGHRLGVGAVMRNSTVRQHSDSCKWLTGTRNKSLCIIHHDVLSEHDNCIFWIIFGLHSNQ